MKSKENPADLASRGCTMDELVNNNLWWNGPEWLQKPNSTPPYEQERLDNPNEEAFQKDSSLQEWNRECHLSKDNDQEKVHISRVHPSLDIDIIRYSSKQRLIRITATVLRFLGELKGKNFSSYITRNEIDTAEEIWIRHTQRANIQDVLEALQNKKRNNLQSQLGIYLDNKGLMRCKGRLENSDLTESARCPILLPKNDRFTILVIEEVHTGVNLLERCHSKNLQVKRVYFI